MIEKVIINIEKSRKIFYQETDYNVVDYLLKTSWHLELPNKKLEHWIEKKSLKGAKGVRKEIHSINGTII